MSYTKRFDEIGKDDIALAGGKGANLGELSRAGMPVPPGFVITTAAYDAFVESNGIGGEIVKLASAPRAEDRAALERVSERIHALFSGGKVIEEMAEEIRAACEKLDRAGETAVAVRSSATAEDLAGASFAGQQETFLNVRGEEALMEAVKDCWGLPVDGTGDGLPQASGNSPRDRKPGGGRSGDGRIRGVRGDVHRQPSERPTR